MDRYLNVHSNHYIKASLVEEVSLQQTLCDDGERIAIFVWYGEDRYVYYGYTIKELVLLELTEKECWAALSRVFKDLLMWLADPDSEDEKFFSIRRRVDLEIESGKTEDVSGEH